MAGLPDQDPERLLFATPTGTPLDPRNMVERIFSHPEQAARLSAFFFTGGASGS